MSTSTDAPTERTDILVAMEAAAREAAAIGGRIFPCTVFKQGDRTMVSTAFPNSFINRQVVRDSAVKGSSPRDSLNRPLMPEHAKLIKEYVVANRDLATQIDWRRTAPLWRNNIISGDNKISTRRGPVNAAANAVKAVLGL
jgi:hypothetical protein